MWGANPNNPSPIEVNDRMFRMSEIKAITRQAASNSDKEPEPEFVPLTPEQEVRRREAIAKMRQQLIDRGIVGNKPIPKKSDVEWHENCVVCGEKNPPNMARVCSGKCYQKSPNPDLV
jgi:hypothetical protein